MTSLDDHTQHDPVQERLARIEKRRAHFAAVGGEPPIDVDVRDLLAFARDVLTLAGDAGPAYDGRILVAAIHDAANEHLGGTT